MSSGNKPLPEPILTNREWQFCTKLLPRFKPYIYICNFLNNFGVYVIKGTKKFACALFQSGTLRVVPWLKPSMPLISIIIPLTHWGRDKMDAISQMIFSYAFSWMKMYELRLKFHWRLFPRVKINNIPAFVQIMAWRRPGEKPLSEPIMVTYWRIYASLGLNELTILPNCMLRTNQANTIPANALAPNIARSSAALILH